MMRPLPSPSVTLVTLGVLLVASPAPAREASTSGPAKARKKEGSTLTLRFSVRRGCQACGRVAD